MGERRSGDWETILVFVSSTFTDMHAERDALREVFEQLGEWLLTQRRFLVAIDLRWGVDTTVFDDEQAKELHVLKVCLEEIRRSRPFFVGLLGDRYGWVPDEDRLRRALRDADADVDVEIAGLSITALEVEFGVFAAPEQQRRSSFFLRTPLPYDEVQPEQRARFSDAYATDPDAPRRVAELASLRDRIRRDLPDRWQDYTLGWASGSDRPPGIDDFAAKVSARLRADIEEELRRRGDLVELADAVGGPSASPVAPDEWELEEFFADRRRTVVGREQLVSRLERRVTRPEPADLDESWRWWVPQRGVRVDTRCVVLTAGAGSGKSTVMASLAERLAGRDDLTVLAHAAGAGPRSASVELLLRRWTAELQGHLGEPVAPVHGDLGTHRLEFQRLLAKVAADHLVVLLVDAVDQFEATADAEHLTFLPDPLPANVRVVASGQPGRLVDRLLARSDVERLELPPLDGSSSADLMRRVGATHRREVDDRLLAATLDGRAEPTPLWVRLAIEALLLLDEDDFSRTDTFPGSPEQQLHALLCETGRSLPDGAVAMFERQFDLAEERFGTWARVALQLVATSRSGLREVDLRGILPGLTGRPWDELEFARFRRSLRAVFSWRRDGRLDFRHAQGRLAAQWCCTVESPVVVHRAIAEHLDALGSEDPVRRHELLHHLLRAGQDRRARDVLIDGSTGGAGIRTAVAELHRAPDVTIAVLAEGARDARGPADRLQLGRVVIDQVLPAARVAATSTQLALVRAVQETAQSSWGDLPDAAGSLYDDAVLAEAEILIDAGEPRSEVDDLLSAVLHRRGEPSPGAPLRVAEVTQVVRAWRLRGALAMRDGEPSAAVVSYRRASRLVESVLATAAASANPEQVMSMYADVLLELARAGAESLDPRHVAIGRASLDRALDLVLSTPVGSDAALRGRALALRAEQCRDFGSEGGRVEAMVTMERAHDQMLEAVRRDPDDPAQRRRALDTTIEMAELATDLGYLRHAGVAMHSVAQLRSELPRSDEPWVRAFDARSSMAMVELARVRDDAAALTPALASCLVAPDAEPIALDLAAHARAARLIEERRLTALEQLQRNLGFSGGALVLGPPAVLVAIGAASWLGVLVIGFLSWFGDVVPDLPGGQVDDPGAFSQAWDRIVGASVDLWPWFVVLVAGAVAFGVISAFRRFSATVVAAFERSGGATPPTSWSPRRMVIASVAAAVVLCGLLLGVAAVSVAVVGAMADRWVAVVPFGATAVVFAAVAATAVVVADVVVAARRLRSLAASRSDVPPEVARVLGVGGDVPLLSREVVLVPATEPVSATRTDLLAHVVDQLGCAQMLLRLGRGDDARAAATSVEGPLAAIEAGAHPLSIAVDAVAARCWQSAVLEATGSAAHTGRNAEVRRELLDRGTSTRLARDAAVHSLMADRGELGHAEDLAADAALVGAGRVLPDDVDAQLALAAAELVRSRALSSMNLSGPSASVAVDGQRRLRRLRRRGVILPMSLVELALDVGAGGAASAPSRLRPSGWRITWSNVRATTATVWGYRTELLPVLVGLVAWLVLARGVVELAGATTDARASFTRVVLTALVAVVVGALVGLCWLTPDRRDRSRDRRAGSRSVASELFRFHRVVINAAAPEGTVDAVLADRLGGERDQWRAGLATLAVAPMSIRLLERQTADELAREVTSAGGACSVESDGWIS